MRTFKLSLLITLLLSVFSQQNVCGQPGRDAGNGRPGRLGGGRPDMMGGMSGRGGSANGAATTYPYETNINDKWRYDSETDTYYIVGIVYCSNPADRQHEQMGIYVPAAYMDAVKSSDSTFTCTVNTQRMVSGLSATSAPIVLPVNTPGYSAMSAPSGSNRRVKEFTDEGLIYLSAGCRGKESGAPAGVTDLKAAVRYFRYLAQVQKAVPGNADEIYSFGHSGGGAQSAILGSSGDSPLYDAYLKAIGAEMAFSDALGGSMCWCPITNFDQADAAYEWNMGASRSNLSDEESNISLALTKEFAEYINSVGFVHPSTGKTLKLDSTADGRYQSGSYYDYVIDIINDAVKRYNNVNGSDVVLYKTGDEDALADFSKNHKRASKGIGAFDDYDAQGRTSAENLLFSTDGQFAHFSKVVKDAVDMYTPDYSAKFIADMAKKDAVGTDLATRMNMYTPLYFLISSKQSYPGGGKGSSKVAPRWRIRTGITQGDTSLATEINLALALQAYGIKDVDFETIWNQGHTEAEDSGKANTNFINWVKH